MARDLAKVENRVQRADRKVDRRDGILETADPRQRAAQTFGSMRNARRGDAGAAQVLKSLGMLTDSLQDAQGVAQKQYEKDQKDDFEQALIDNMTGTTNEERADESEGYRRGIGMARTETNWYQYKAEADVRLQEFIESQTDPDVNERRKQLVRYIEDEYFGGFVKDPETGEVVDMQHRDGYLLAMEQIQKARPQLLAVANARITERFEGEALNLFQSSVRERAAAGDVVDMNELLSRIPPTVPQEKVTAAYGEAVQTTAEELRREGRYQEAIGLVDQFLGYAEEADPSSGTATVLTGEEAGGVVEVDPPPSEATEADVVERQGRLRIAQDKLAEAVMYVESRGNPNAVSPVGARGTMQTMPGTLKDPGYGVRPAANDSPQELERVGRDYLKAMQSEYSGSIPLALAAYNAGPGNVNKWVANGTVPDPRKKGVSEQDFVNAIPFRETREYVGKVVKRAGASFGKPDTPGMLKRTRDPDYEPEGLDRSIRDRSFDPSLKLLPELKGRLAPTSQQRTSMLQYRESLVKGWETYDREETGRIAAEVQGTFSLRLAGKGPALTDADVEVAHRSGQIDDLQAANWYKSIEAAAQAEEEWNYRVEVRENDRRERARKKQAETIIGNAMADVLSGKVAPRQAINIVMGNLHKISDPILRFETLRTIGGMAETVENVNISTPEAKAFDRNLTRVEDAISTKLPAGNLIYFNDPARGWVRVRRDEAAARAVSQVRSMRVSAIESITETGNVPEWASTQSELQEWMQQNFSNRNPNASAQETAASGRGFGYED